MLRKKRQAVIEVRQRRKPWATQPITREALPGYQRTSPWQWHCETSITGDYLGIMVSEADGNIFVPPSHSFFLSPSRTHITLTVSPQWFPICLVMKPQGTYYPSAGGKTDIQKNHRCLKSRLKHVNSTLGNELSNITHPSAKGFSVLHKISCGYY